MLPSGDGRGAERVGGLAEGVPTSVVPSKWKLATTLKPAQGAKANFANLANGSSSRPSAARAGIVKKQALQFVTIPDKASPFRDDDDGDPFVCPAKSASYS